MSAYGSNYGVNTQPQVDSSILATAQNASGNALRGRPSLRHATAGRPRGGRGRRPPTRQRRQIKAAVLAEDKEIANAHSMYYDGAYKPPPPPVAAISEPSSPANTPNAFSPRGRRRGGASAARGSSRRTGVSANRRRVAMSTYHAPTQIGSTNKRVLRVFLDDTAFKTLPVNENASVKELSILMNRKVRDRDTANFALYERKGNTDVRILDEHELIAMVTRNWTDDHRFVFQKRKPGDEKKTAPQQVFMLSSPKKSSGSAGAPPPVASLPEASSPSRRPVPTRPARPARPATSYHAGPVQDFSRDSYSPPVARVRPPQTVKMAPSSDRPVSGRSPRGGFGRQSSQPSFSRISKGAAPVRPQRPQRQGSSGMIGGGSGQYGGSRPGSYGAQPAPNAAPVAQPRPPVMATSTGMDEIPKRPARPASTLPAQAKATNTSSEPSQTPANPTTEPSLGTATAAIAAEEEFRYKPMNEWSTEDVVYFLKASDLGDWSASFAENEITGVDLPELTTAELKSDLEVTALGARKSILREISNFSPQPRPTTSAPAAATTTATTLPATEKTTTMTTATASEPAAPQVAPKPQIAPKPQVAPKPQIAPKPFVGASPSQQEEETPPPVAPKTGRELARQNSFSVRVKPSSRSTKARTPRTAFGSRASSYHTTPVPADVGFTPSPRSQRPPQVGGWGSGNATTTPTPTTPAQPVQAAAAAPSEPAEPEQRAIIRVNWSDGTFRSFVVSNLTTALQLRDQVAAKSNKGQSPPTDYSQYRIFEQNAAAVQRQLDDSEFPLAVTLKWTDKASKLVFRDRNEAPPKPKKEILRVYFADFTFKSFAGDSSTTVGKLKASVFRKMRYPDSHLYKMYYTGDRVASRELKDDENVLQIRHDAEERDFVVGFKFVVSKEPPTTSFNQSVEEKEPPKPAATPVAASGGGRTSQPASNVSQPNTQAAPVPAVRNSEEQQQQQQRAPATQPRYGAGAGAAQRGLAAMMMGGGGAAGNLAMAMRASASGGGASGLSSAQERMHKQKMQSKAFFAWVNFHLSKREMKVASLEETFSDGVSLLHLLEVISGYQLPKYNTKPRMLLQKLDNLNTALKFVADSRIRVLGCGAEDLLDGNRKLMLSLIWQLVLASAMGVWESQPERTKKKTMIDWIKKNCNNPVQISRWGESFNDGKIFLSLLSSMAKVDVSSAMSISSDRDRLAKALELGESELGIPSAALDADDMHKNDWSSDDRSIFTYLCISFEYLSYAASM